MSGEHSCDNCGSSTSNEPMCLCDACNDAEADMAAAHAAGYAEAVADVRTMLRACDLAARERLASPNERPVLEYTSKIFGEVIGLLDSGAHVGAAKKGGDQ